MKSSFQIQATVVANQFIDEYMALANGEYVKVYLYILRHAGEPMTVGTIADGLNDTEADVCRAIAYWKKQGVLTEDAAVFQSAQVSQGAIPSHQGAIPSPQGAAPAAPAAPTAPVSRRAVQSSQGDRTAAALEKNKLPAAVREEKPLSARSAYTPDQVNKLALEEDFTQLLYIAQKYLNKVFTPRDCELFAYLYDGLHMSAELLEYLVEYCVQNGHDNLRYMETVALNWHEQGIRTVNDAKSRVADYTKDTFAVMKAFGLGDRKPANVETEMIRRWFKEYGFSRELVVEACNRTIRAIHNPSFQYADKILGEWMKSGVRSMRDIQALDERRESKTVRPPVQPKTVRNQFHNFEQRDTDYDAMVLERVKERLKERIGEQ